MATSVLGLDVGAARIGVARVHMLARLPEPLTTLQNDATFTDKLRAIIAEYDIDTIVVGLPRNMSGEETAQTQAVREFCAAAITPLGVPIVWQDETLTTVAAAEQAPSPLGIDAIAASEILNDYIKAL